MIPPLAPPRPRALELKISWLTMLKVATFAIAVFLAITLRGFIGLLLLALLIAVSLEPLARAVCRRGAPSWVGVLVCAVVLFGSVGLFFFVVTPVALSQLSGLIKTLPTFKDHILQHLPPSGELRNVAEGILKAPTFSNPTPLLEKFMAWGAVAVQAVFELFVVLIVAIYLVADGKRVYGWLTAFLPERQQTRLAQAAGEVCRVVYRYMLGQVITSTICGLYLWVVLSLLQVPNALLLAVIAGVFDVLPLVGFFLALAPALALAATVSPLTSAYVAALYLFYHVMENYLIVPRIYGNQLRLSTLTVFVTCLAAGIVGGVVGVIVVLPLIASYPIIERIWLKPILGRETVARHEEIDELEHPA